MGNPWIGVSLVVIGLGAIILFSLLKIPEGGIAFAVITAGIAVINGRIHENTQKELTTLRRSMRPPTFPSIHPDPDVRIPPESGTGRFRIPPSE